ncbi:uncharacterized protein LOC106006808 isoform X2 [Mustela putorius furo]|nr:uncharacterized protein LOC106006808 isoform X2 [Mustela putorius furo]
MEKLKAPGGLTCTMDSQSPFRASRLSHKKNQPQGLCMSLLIRHPGAPAPCLVEVPCKPQGYHSSWLFPGEGREVSADLLQEMDHLPGGPADAVLIAGWAGGWEAQGSVGLALQPFRCPSQPPQRLGLLLKVTRGVGAGKSEGQSWELGSGGIQSLAIHPVETLGLLRGVRGPLGARQVRPPGRPHVFLRLQRNSFIRGLSRLILGARAMATSIASVKQRVAVGRPRTGSAPRLAQPAGGQTKGPAAITPSLEKLSRGPHTIIHLAGVQTPNTLETW